MDSEGGKRVSSSRCHALRHNNRLHCPGHVKSDLPKLIERLQTKNAELLASETKRAWNDLFFLFEMMKKKNGNHEIDIPKVIWYTGI